MRSPSFTITAVDRVTQTLDRISSRIEQMNQPFDRLSRAMKRFSDVSGFDKVSKSIGRVAAQVKNMLGWVLKLGAPLLALFGGGTLAGIYQMTERWAQLGFAVSTTSQILGISAQRLMNWRGVGDLVGISAETMTKGLQGLQGTLQDAKWGRNQMVAGTLRMLGIDLGSLSDKAIDTEKVMMQVADKIQKIQKVDPAAANRLAASLGVTELMPVLMNGSAALKKYYADAKRLQGDITPALTQRASKFAERLNEMKLATAGMKIAIADKLIPVFQPLIEKWTEWLVLNREKVSTKIAELAERLAKWLDKIDINRVLDGIVAFIDGCVKLTEWIDKVVDKLGGWKNTLLIIGGVLAVGFVSNIGIAVFAIGGMITKIGLAILSLGKLKAGMAVVAAAFVGWEIGGAIRNKYMETEGGRNFDNILGGTIATMLSKLPSWMGGNDARQALDNEMSYRSGLGAPPASAGAGTGVKISRRNQTIEFLVKKGMTYGAAVGVASSLNEESGFNHQIYGGGVEGKGKPQEAYGIAQWHPDRQRNISAAFNKSIKDMSFEEQLEAMWWELQNTHKLAGNKLMSARTPEEGAFAHSKYYEVAGGRSGNSSIEATRRAGEAREMYNSLPPNLNVQVTVNKDNSVTTRTSTDSGIKVNHSQPVN